MTAKVRKWVPIGTFAALQGPQGVRLGRFMCAVQNKARRDEMYQKLKNEFEEVQLSLATALAQRVFLDHKIKDLIRLREKIRLKAKRHGKT